MDTNRLRQFCAIAETGSLTQAARLLHITHSGLSKSMKLLQEELHCVLLQPAGRGLSLTAKGLQIYQRAKIFLEQEEQLFKFENNASSNSLRIGTVEIFLLSLAEQLKYHPFNNFHFTLLDLDPGTIEQQVANKQLDFGITYAPFPLETIEISEIGKFRLGCYHLKNTFEQHKLTEIPFVVPARGLSSNPLGIRERDGWLDTTLRNKKYSVNLLSTAIELTLQGLCAIYMPEFVAQKINACLKTKNTLIEYPLPKNQKHLQRLFLIKHKERVKDATYKQLFNMMKGVIIP